MHTRSTTSNRKPIGAKPIYTGECDLMNDVESGSKSYNSLPNDNGWKWKSRHQKASVSLTLGIFGIIFSMAGFILLVTIIQNECRPAILLRCGVDNFKSLPSARTKNHDYSAKCQFINLDMERYQRPQNIVPCGFDQYREFIYANVPFNYQARESTEIFRLPCNYSVRTYCPLEHAHTNARTSTLNIYPTGHTSVENVSLTCMEHPERSIMCIIILVSLVIISVIMVYNDVTNIFKTSYSEHKVHNTNGSKKNYNGKKSIYNMSNECIIVYPDGDYSIVE